MQGKGPEWQASENHMANGNCCSFPGDTCTYSKAWRCLPLPQALCMLNTPLPAEPHSCPCRFSRIIQQMGSISKECPKCCPTCVDVQGSTVYNCFNVGNLAATRWRIGCGSWAHEMLLTVWTPEQGRLFGRGIDITNETIKKNEVDEQVALKQLVLRQEG